MKTAQGLGKKVSKKKQSQGEQWKTINRSEAISISALTNNFIQIRLFKVH
jgi:hypothetical protein